MQGFRCMVAISCFLIAVLFGFDLFANEVISLGESETACAAWSDHGNRIMTSRLTAGKWSKPETMNGTENCPEHSPSVIAGTDGSFHVVWIKDEGDKSYVYYSRYSSAGWSSEELVNTHEAIASQPAICLDKAGNPSLVWSASE